MESGVKTLKLNAVVGHQMDDKDGSSLGAILDTDDGDYLLLAPPDIMMDAAGKMHLSAKQSLELQGRKDEHISALAPTAKINSLAVVEVFSDPPHYQLAVSVSLGDNTIPLSFCFSQEDIDIMAAALAMKVKPKLHQ